VHDSIEDGIGKGSITQVGVPLIDRQLTGNQRGASVIPIIKDLEQIPYRLTA